MPKINELTEQRILAAARVTDILADMGVEMHKAGPNLTALCPFHEDRHLGSFMISESKNICTCYAGCGTFNSKTLSAKFLNLTLPKDYVKVMAYLGALYNIPIDDEPMPHIRQKVMPRPVVTHKPLIVFNKSIINQSLHLLEQNTLMKYLFSLPLSEEDAYRRKLMCELYLVGTSTKPRMNGWTIWWQVDDKLQVHQGHMMAYRPDGHRDKEANPYVVDGKTFYHHTDWVARLLKVAGFWSEEKNETNYCLFGLHLVDCFKDAEICLVESEKTALICSFFTDPRKRLWMATAGMRNFKREMLQPLIDRKRYIAYFPDKDGYDKWTAMADMIAYPRLYRSDILLKEWKESDGPKADIADIMLRRLQERTHPEPEETLSYKLATKLGAPEQAENLQYLIDKLDLQLNN